MKPEELLSSLQALVRLTFADQRRLSAEAVQGKLRFDGTRREPAYHTGIGSFLGRLSKHIADWPASAFDSASVLRVCASVIGRCQSNDATVSLFIVPPTPRVMRHDMLNVSRCSARLRRSYTSALYASASAGRPCNPSCKRQQSLQGRAVVST